ncbi:MAG: hypothetical protein HY525_05440 [Betaproteobacteria bacterium]|nr:hypothetical protein [Betaproteobacteria bacterium]
MSSAKLPRNTTRQAEEPLYGEISRILHRITGTVIVVFVLVHVLGQGVLHVSSLASLKESAPWLPTLQSQHWIRALLLPSIVFHTIYGLRLLATDLGLRMDYKASLWITVCVSAVFGLWEIARYGGV